ncbi:metallophosphoesterase family protein [Methanobrevibacter sp.]|uniref:metallophosphoesterase family protein n=1 Tax=Methanobrevibacter sp. TaxID=66852 RepID=UPI002E774D35|nr:exonuclease SbcCD subunit D [Methanobrevibacter sp.]MEE1335613.1 exonuclease SbcCD subunit D [Methanobrevibacter sp.]
MKFAHLADTHLGYRQYGLFEREKDFYEVFDKVIDKIIEEKVDFVIHSGDLFETARPSPMALLTFQKGLLKLKGAGIPMYAIAGNHDVVMRKGSIPPHVIFKKMGLKVISTINPTYMHGDIFIAGLPYYPASHGKALKSKLAELSEKAAHHEKSILVLHQGIDKYFSMNYELEIGEIPDNFDYYALGHIHKYVNDAYGKGRLVYPGSGEIWKTSELPDYKKNGKGFVVVDFDGSKPIVKRVTVDVPREFIDKKINYNDLESGIAGIKEIIKDFDKKPILKITINGVESDTSRVYEIIKDELGDLALMIRPTFIMAGEEIEINEIESKRLGPEQLLESQLEGYGNGDVTTLAIDLYHLLSKEKLDESQELINQYFNDHFSYEIEDDGLETDEFIMEQPPKEKEDIQITFDKRGSE